MIYTEEQKNIMINLYGSVEKAERISKINNARSYLLDTDYIANKIIEYQFLNKELDNDYTDILNKREEAREVIRKYESR